ncbi:MAG: haloacid dehalogenase type II [Thiotrichaceae bacterium]
MAKFKNIQVCVFDAYGTLFDVTAVVAQYKTQLGDKAMDMAKLWRAKQLEYTWLRSLMQKHGDFWSVTQDALAYTFKTFNIANSELFQELMRAYLQPPVYPEVKACLQCLKEAKMPIVILSNGTPQMLESAVKHADLTDLIDHIISVEQVKIYKPDARVYRLVMDKLQLTSLTTVCFQSANGWDIAGAAAFGFRTVWINRHEQAQDNLPGIPEIQLPSLSEFPSIVL